MSDSSDRDRLYADGSPAQSDFVFDDAVAAVFPDMIKRSVPGYPAIVNMIQLLAGQYAQADSTLYDLGCSLGASTAALALGAADRRCRIVAVDNAPAMLARAQSNLARSYPQVEWHCADIRDVPIAGGSVVVLNFTLQFLPTSDRLSLLRTVHDGLRPGGILVLSEKIAGQDEQADALLTDMHHAFKRANGYSQMEVSRKRTALENVLVPESLACHQARLSEAGFSRSDLWFQCFNFMSLVAFK